MTATLDDQYAKAHVDAPPPQPTMSFRTGVARSNAVVGTTPDVIYVNGDITVALEIKTTVQTQSDPDAVRIWGHEWNYLSDNAGHITFNVSIPNARYVKLLDGSGGFHFLPWDRLDDEEKALLENDQLREDTLAGLKEIQTGEGMSTDWLFADKDE